MLSRRVFAGLGASAFLAMVGIAVASADPPPAPPAVPGECTASTVTVTKMATVTWTPPTYNQPLQPYPGGTFGS